MMRMKKIGSSVLRHIFGVSLVALVLHPVVSQAATRCDSPVAKMVSVQGNVTVRLAGQTPSQAARLNDTYCPGDRIVVGDKSRADVALVNQPVLRLDQNTNITLVGLKDGRASLISLASGAMHFFSRLPRNLEINTAFVNAGVEGTEGLVQVEADRTIVTIFEGKVLAANPGGSLSLTNGQSAVAEKGKPPVYRTVVRPRDAVQWALYYPPVTYFRAEDFRGPEPWRGMVRNSIDAYMKGDYQGAFEALKGVPGDIRDPRLFAYRAQLLLGVGRMDEAGRDIGQALSLNPNDSDAMALQSIVSVVQNDTERALTVAQKAVAADPKSASALTALSYAQQANVNLEGARKSLQQAVQANPANALAWARLAELHASFSKLDDALEAAQKAVALDPNLSRTQMVLGFAHLMRVNTHASKAAFEKAIALDQADSLSRLGLGLAKIREGALEEGRKEIEIAASLDPNNAIVRSYLGKAYYEEKRPQLTDREFATAKELDPKDPTPFFYDAIQKQTTNRPVEALQDMQKAMELNENRAIYRSRLQLDSDLAARSASLSRIYSNLGFEQLALIEGWKSVNTDPSSYSAHRFLADSYAVRPRHEIARVSELLQSQLLQPLNMTPIQPSLAESNLFLISALGPGAVSFNEFNPLFNRDGMTFQTSGLVGEHDTYAGEGILSGIYKKFAFSLGGSHFDTDGWRDNADQRDNIANAFVQMELSPKTSVQAEYRYRDLKTGDLKLNFDPEDFSKTFKNDIRTDTWRFGLRHAQSPSSIFLGSFIFQERDEGIRDRPFPDIEVDLQRQNYTGLNLEMQHLFRSPYVNLTSGFGFFRVTGKQDFIVNVDLPPEEGGPITFGDTVNKGVKHYNFYAYSYFSPLKNVTFTLGGSGDFFDPRSASAASAHRFNPKFGVVWNPFPSTTVRAAAFRVLRRTLITNQTLEPTQVAGFNQFFDDNDTGGVRSWRYGGAIDQKLSRNLYGGVEYSWRDLTLPFEIQGEDGVTHFDSDHWDEELARAYLFWTPHPWLALRAEYQYEEFKREGFTVFTKRSQTHSMPLGANFHHPSGLSASLQTTYYHQHGQFFPQGGIPGEFNTGTSDFWLVDVGLNYRLPKRFGLISVGVKNLFDNQFKFQDTDFVNPKIQPNRMAFFKVTLEFP